MFYCLLHLHTINNLRIYFSRSTYFQLFCTSQNIHVKIVVRNFKMFVLEIIQTVSPYYIIILQKNKIQVLFKQVLKYCA